MEEMARKSPLSANDIADWFINKVDRSSGKVITALMVQRLVYFAKAWYLGNKGRPLFEDDFEAWATGPIVRSIFERFENFAYANVPEIVTSRVISGDKLELLEGVHIRYGHHTAETLEILVQEPGGPWQTTRGRIAPEASSNTIVPKDALKKFYGQKIDKAWA